jgi:hypothetical protein
MLRYKGVEGTAPYILDSPEGGKWSSSFLAALSQRKEAHYYWIECRVGPEQSAHCGKEAVLPGIKLWSSSSWPMYYTGFAELAAS